MRTALILMWSAILSMVTFMLWNNLATNKNQMMYIDLFNVFTGLSTLGFLVALHRRKDNVSHSSNSDSDLLD